MEPPLVVFFFFFFLFPALVPAAITDSDVQTAADALRSGDRGLFANAILSSDLRFRLASPYNASYTLLAPPDPSVHHLGLRSQAALYVRTLSRHILLGGFSIADLRRLPLGAALSTLLPGGALAIGRANRSGVVTMDGIAICCPDLYLTAGISIHGVDAILDGRSRSALKDLRISRPPLVSDPPKSKKRHGSDRNSGR